MNGKPPNSSSSSSYAVVDLAIDLETTVAKVWPLIEHGYVLCTHRTDSALTTLVEKPLPGMMEWLRDMCAPLDRRPMIPLAYLADAYLTTVAAVREYCRDAGVPVSMDPVFGELVTLNGAYHFDRAIWKERNPMAYNRQSFLQVFSLLHGLSYRRHPIRHDQRVEAEIRRIANLPEPDRTIAATEFWAAWSDARALAGCLSAYFCKRPGKAATAMLARIQRKVDAFEKRLTGKEPWEKKKRRRRKKYWTDRNPRTNAKAYDATLVGGSSAPGRSPACESSAPCDVPSSPPEAQGPGEPGPR